MQVKYDKFNRFETPKMTLCGPGAEYNNGAITKTLGVLPCTSDEELVANFNEISSFNFVVYKVSDDDDPAGCYQAVKNRMTVFLDGIGFFVITDVTESITDESVYKSVSSSSCDIEIENKTIPADFYSQESEIQNSYNVTFNFVTLLEMLVSNLPLWQIGHIDESLTQKYRTFEDVSESTNILSFMLNDMQDAFECIFVFDTINRLVNVYDQNSYVRETDIHITNTDLINSIEVNESSSDIYTALSVFGDNDITISGINPTGSNVIYKFDYYIDSMSNALGYKVNEWQSLVNNYLDDYYELNVDYYSHLGLQSDAKSEVDRIKSLIELYKKCRDNIVAASNMQDTGLVCFVVSGEAGDRISSVVQETNSSGASIDLEKTFAEELTVSSNEAFLTHTPTDNIGSSIKALYVKNNNGIYIRELTQALAVAPGKYVYNSSANKVVFNPGELQNGTKIGVFYHSEDAGINEDAIRVTNLIAEIDSEIESLSADLELAEEDLYDISQEIIPIKAQIDNIRENVEINSYFTQSELDELSLYIYEGSYKDDYVIITDSMTYPEQLEQMKTLYDRAAAQLERISKPTSEFTIDVENFIFNSRFADWADQLETGCLINVELRPDDVAKLFLSKFSVNYDDSTLSMTFGNRFNKYDTKSLFNDLLGGISRTANTLNFVKEVLYPIKSGELDLIKTALSNIRTLSAGQALTSQDQDFIIDSTGITGRQSDGDGDYYPEQLKIINNTIALTDDGWETCKLAIGKLLMPNGDSKYGVNAELLMGDIIVGNSLHIMGEDEFGNPYDILSAMNGEISLRATKTELLEVEDISTGAATSASNAATSASNAATSASNAAASASGSATAAQAAQAAAEDVQTRADSGEFTSTLLRVDSSRGTSFKHNAISTVLSAVLYHGSERIETISKLHEIFGNGAYLQWSWQAYDSDLWTTISNDDSRVGNNGFTLTISDSDVDIKSVFQCNLIV